MPRTKQVKNISVTKDERMECFQEYKTVYLRLRQHLEKQKEEILQKFRLLSKRDRLAIPVSIGNKTFKELRQKSNWQTFSSVSHWSVASSICPSVETEKSKKKTSDDGYLTSDSRNDTSGGSRASRATRRTRSASATTQKSTRVTRSISRDTTMEKSTVKKTARKSRSVSRNSNKHLQVNKFKTPMNTRVLNNIGMVTPKIKPNTPSVVLRRPQQGELAISLQGSPLMTTAMVTETTANINIPLGDGRMMNIQPMKGMRRSEIPDLDPEIKRQLKTLRDNLDKVFQYSMDK